MRSGEGFTVAARRLAQGFASCLLLGVSGLAAAAPEFELRMQTPPFFDTGNIGANGEDSLRFDFVLLNGETANAPFTLRATLPAHVAYRDKFGSNWTCSWSAPVVTCTYSTTLTAANWGSSSLGIYVDVDEDLPVPGNSMVRMTLENAQTPLPDPLDCTSTVIGNGATSRTGCVEKSVAHRQSEVKFVPETWSHQPPIFEVGVINQFSVGFQNIGFSQQNGTVTARFLLPPGLVFHAARGQVTWTCNAAMPDAQGQLVTCTTPYFFDGMGPQQANITVDVNVTEAVAIPGPVPIYGTISNAAQPPPDFPLCDDATPPTGCGYYTIPTRAARLSRMDVIEMESALPEYTQGDEARVTVRYSNIGEGSATAVTLSFAVPRGFSYSRVVNSSPAVTCVAVAGTPQTGQTVECRYPATYPVGIDGVLNLFFDVEAGAAPQSELVASASDDGLPGPSLAQCVADPADPDPMVGCGRLVLQVSPWIFCDGFEALARVCGQPQRFQ